MNLNQSSPGNDRLDLTVLMTKFYFCMRRINTRDIQAQLQDLYGSEGLFIARCDGLIALADAIEAVFLKTHVQPWITPMMRTRYDYLQCASPLLIHLKPGI
ncbi:hypothetical protein [Leptothermofonsia sp. ETS-13]|uniref:hypothetical protein n=1 Tax=Leptothermofonsia sp. ETS-13 TaxID=3035696 RepID=UPI003BA07BCE